jgi:hypothetical protein
MRQLARTFRDPGTLILLACAILLGVASYMGWRLIAGP